MCLPLYRNALDQGIHGLFHVHPEHRNLRYNAHLRIDSHAGVQEIMHCVHYLLRRSRDLGLQLTAVGDRYACARHPRWSPIAHLARAAAGFANGPVDAVGEGGGCGVNRPRDRLRLNMKRRIKKAASATKAQMPN